MSIVPETSGVLRGGASEAKSCYVQAHYGGGECLVEFYFFLIFPLV